MTFGSNTELGRSPPPEPISRTVDGLDQPYSAPPIHSRKKYLWVLLTIIVLAGTTTVLVRAPSLSVTAVVTLTETGFPKYAPIIADGPNIYFTQVAFGRYQVLKLDRASNELSIVPTSVGNPYLCDLSLDRKAMLLRDISGGFDDYGSLFIQDLNRNIRADPLPITAFDGAWSPDGRTIAYSRGPELSLFDSVTKASKVVARVEGFIWWPRWMPKDANRLRFTVTDSRTQMTTIWEVQRDGSKLHRIFRPQDQWFHAGAGSWSTDGRFFLFQVGPLADSKLWMRDEGWSGVLRRQNPVQLTAETSMRGPVIEADGSTILARSQVSPGNFTKD